jgi:transposase-like protein
MARDFSEVVRLYVEEQRSYAEIAREYGVTKQTIARWLRAAGISARPLSEATKLGMRNYIPTVEARRKMAENAARMRQRITPATHEKQRQTMKGRPPPNKGKPWSKAQHAKIGQLWTPERRELASERSRGEKSPAWRGGQTPEETLRMQRWEWRRRRAECYERDNWTCRDCGVKCHHGVRIAAHHVIPRRHGGSDDLDNLLTLCGSCHSRRESLYRSAFIA